MMARILRSAAAWGTLALAMRVGGAAVLLPLTTRALDPVSLGMWYVFTTILGFSAVMDAGMTGLLARRFVKRLGALRLPRPRRSALALLGSARLLFGASGLLTLLLLGGGGGWWVWQRSADLPDPGAVRQCFLLLCLSFLLFSATNFGRALLFGLNRLDLFQAAMTAGLALQFLLSAGGLLLGWGLPALVLGNVALFCALTASLPLALRVDRSLAARLIAPLPVDGRVTRRVLRLSVATFLNTLGVYLAVNVPVLTASLALGLADTASLGLTLQVFLILSQAASVWVETKQPMFARLHRESRSDLHRLFVGRVRLAVLLYTVGTAGLLGFGNILLELIGARTHFLPLPPALLVATLVFFSVHQSMHEWLSLCLGRNPFTRPLLASGVLSVLLGFLLARLGGGVTGLLLGAILPQLAFCAWRIPLTTLRTIELKPLDYFRMLLGFRPSSAKK